MQERLLATLIGRSYRVAQRSGLPVYWLDETRQAGGGFGQRLADAYRQVFDQGYEAVIAIGNDCPDLLPGDLVAAAQQLARYPMVCGPAADGGAYLIGLRREAFDAAGLAALDWDDTQSRTALDGYATRWALAVAWLAEKTDLDHAGALVRWLAQPQRAGALARLLRSLLQRATATPRPPDSFALPADLPRRPWAGRAPPAQA